MIKEHMDNKYNFYPDDITEEFAGKYLPAKYGYYIKTPMLRLRILSNYFYNNGITQYDACYTKVSYDIEDNIHMFRDVPALYDIKIHNATFVKLIRLRHDPYYLKLHYPDKYQNLIKQTDYIVFSIDLPHENGCIADFTQNNPLHLIPWKNNIYIQTDGSTIECNYVYFTNINKMMHDFDTEGIKNYIPSQDILVKFTKESTSVVDVINDLPAIRLYPYDITEDHCKEIMTSKSCYDFEFFKPQLVDLLNRLCIFMSLPEYIIQRLYNVFWTTVTESLTITKISTITNSSTITKPNRYNLLTEVICGIKVYNGSFAKLIRDDCDFSLDLTLDPNGNVVEFMQNSIVIQPKSFQISPFYIETDGDQIEYKQSIMESICRKKYIEKFEGDGLHTHIQFRDIWILHKEKYTCILNSNNTDEIIEIDI